MKLSNSFFITKREFPNDENTISAKLLVKSGMIIKNDIGIYTYLPIGLKVIDNIKKIIRDEMARIDADEVLMPSLVNENVFEKSERLDLLNDELYKIKDRDNNSLCLCPTHEELFAFLSKSKIKSYKDLHFTLYQISNKYRDEIKCEYGLNRIKEIHMADAYSFDADESGLDVSYDKIYQAYKRIFSKMLLNTLTVESNPRQMKGYSSEEFQVISKYGTNKIVKCTNCDYSSILENAECKIKKEKDEVIIIERTLLKKTPNIKTVKKLSEFFKTSEENIIKSLVIKVDGIYKMILLRGNAQLNFEKLKNILKTEHIEIPSERELENIGTYVGFVGPIKCTMEIIADNEIKQMHNVICGSNKKDYHYINVNPGIDFKINRYADIKLFEESDLCPCCKSKCSIINGTEIAHIFKLNDNYSENYNLKYMNEKNELSNVYMGSYGIGIDRCLSAIVENNYDDKGIVWPMMVAPYKVCIVVVNINDDDQEKYSKLIYSKLTSSGIDTLLDDRKESLGVKFADMDLIGIPIRITVGYKCSEGIIEFKLRTEQQTTFIKLDELLPLVNKTIELSTIYY